MLKIKRLYTFMLQSFLPLFVMTFFICLFIVLMQFLWRFVDEFVGKGLEVMVIAELFFYAALTFVPLALPLSVLLASLMTFGNLGERFELTAMKASGVSLLKTMRPLIVLMAFVAIGAFFFQNNVLPVAQAKMYTLLYSIKQKSPEVEIPEGVFYDQIPGFNLFVETKNRDTGVLYDMIIYDVSKGSENATIILADSGKLSITDDKTHLFLKLWNGEQFENLREQAMSSTNVPYRREEFVDKEVLVKFDANFNRMDESGMRNQYVGKNIQELQATIDSVNHRVDSIGALYAQNLKEIPYFGLPYYKHIHLNGQLTKIPQPQVVLNKPVDVDSVFRGINPSFARSYLTQALAKANRAKQDYEFKSMSMQDDRKTIRRHGIELMKKFTLSMACLVFFFIGAPLGAIIRKGGLGTPLVISVFLFIFYWIVDNTGYKMARDGRLEVWEGIWLSTFVLLPLGIFFTYKAVNDSAVFNRDAYANFFRKLFGRAGVRHLEVKEVVMDEVEMEEGVSMVEALMARSDKFVRRYASRQSYLSYWTEGYDRDELNGLRVQLDATVEYFSNSRDRMVILKLMDFPILRSLWFYHPSTYKWIGWCCAMLFPIGIVGYIVGVKSQLKLKEEIKHIITVGGDLLVLMKQPSSEMSNKE